MEVLYDYADSDDLREYSVMCCLALGLPELYFGVIL